MSSTTVAGAVSGLPEQPANDRIAFVTAIAVKLLRLTGFPFGLGEPFAAE